MGEGKALQTQSKAADFMTILVHWDFNAWLIHGGGV